MNLLAVSQSFESGARHLRISRGISVRGNGNNPDAASAMTGNVIASSPENTSKVSGRQLSTSAICDMFPLASFTAEYS